jgi:hypothetical protein
MNRPAENRAGRFRPSNRGTRIASSLTLVAVVWLLSAPVLFGGALDRPGPLARLESGARPLPGAPRRDNDSTTESARRGEAQAEQQLPKSQVPALGRPTKADDPAPVLDFLAYFNGAWAFTWDYPDSPLGPAGSLEGTTTFKGVDEKFFEAITTAKGQAGPVTIREEIGYLKDMHTLSRTVTDSRGFSYLQIGTVAGDLGGQFTIRFESSPFVHNGRTIRVRSVMRLLSPLNYRTQTSISVDGGPFTNYGNPWWKKEGASR